MKLPLMEHETVFFPEAQAVNQIRACYTAQACFFEQNDPTKATKGALVF